MRIAGSIVVVLFAIAGAAGGSGCKDKAKPKAAPAPAPAVIDAAPAGPIDAAGPVAAAAPSPLTPPVGARGVQIRDLQYGGFAAPGLPAIKADGSEVVTTAVADDGGRGYLDLHFLVLDGADGHVRNDVRLANPDETSEAETADDQAGNLDVETALFARVRDRVAQANAWLAAGTYRDLATVARADEGPPQPSEAIVVGDLTFTYDLGARRLTVTRGGQAVATHDLSKRVPKPSTRSDSPCPGDLAYLHALHVDAPSKKVVVELGAYAQGHNCGSNGPIFTIVPLP